MKLVSTRTTVGQLSPRLASTACRRLDPSDNASLDLEVDVDAKSLWACRR